MDLGTQFFTAAKDQHESAAKWSLIVLVVLLYFHLAIAGPFARQTAAKADIDQRVTANQKIEAQLDPIVTSAEILVKDLGTQIDEASSVLRDDLVAHFRSLDDVIGKLLTLKPQEAEGDPGEQFFAPPESQQQQQQLPNRQEQPATLDGPMPELAQMAPDLRRRVVENGANPNPDPQYATALERYIDVAIIAPAFDRANHDWASRRAQRLADQAVQLETGIGQAIEQTSAAEDQLAPLKSAVATLRTVAQSHSFVAPTDASWWRSVDSKEVSIQSMVESMKQGADKISQQQAALAAARDAASAAVKVNQARAKEVADTLAELERQAKELQAQLGEIGEPLKVISVRLSLLAPLLPLIIAVAMAALTLWRAEALRRMRFAASLVTNDAEGGALRQWLRQAAGGSALRLAVREALVGAVAVVWILAARAAVDGLTAPQLSAKEIVGIAMGVLAAARIYHCYRAGQALRSASATS